MYTYNKYEIKPQESTLSGKQVYTPLSFTETSYASIQVAY